MFSGESSSNRPECTKWGISHSKRCVQLIKSFLNEKTAQMPSVDVTQFSRKPIKLSQLHLKIVKNEIKCKTGDFITKEKERKNFIEGQIYAVNDNNH
jgi:hypothetical protein